MTGGYSRQFPSAQVEKRQAGRRPQIRYTLRLGPRIDQRSGRVFVPNAGPAPELEVALRDTGWHYDQYADGWYKTRFDLVDECTGREYTKEQWLDRARRWYAAAWAWFEEDER